MGAVQQMVWGGVSVQSSLQACSMKYSALLLLSLFRGLHATFSRYKPLVSSLVSSTLAKGL